MILKNLSRREFFTEICSKEKLKEIYGTWNNFNKEMVEESRKMSCEEAGLMLGKNIDKLIAKKLSKTKGG